MPAGAQLIDHYIDACKAYAERGGSSYSEFWKCVRERHKAGAREYGDSAYNKPIGELIGEALQEPVDVVGWLGFVWEREPELREAIVRIADCMFLAWGEVRGLSRRNDD